MYNNFKQLSFENITKPVKNEINNETKINTTRYE